ncbi:MAG: asparagine synthase (glutamine-hydrolyzing) [Polaribacter sp.]|jgi:asparagine synthase (glutamine-hydrolysing)
MCGILGKINYHQAIDKKLFSQMRDTLQHRGPDGCGSTFFQSDRIALGHRRLSIIDLSETGHQPMSNEDATIWVTCNGEIYNYKELRKTLELAGHHFHSQSDMEVLVHGYEEWGVQMLNRLKGMFAFGIWDDMKQELFIARDRFGIKPLYYYPGKNQFLFASELKAIVADPKVPREVDQQSMVDYFKYRSIPSPRSIWKGIYKLPPAHYMLLKSDGVAVAKPYWSLKTDRQQLPIEEVVDKVDGLLETSIRQHLIADVPVGLLLSGGFDSSSIASYLSRMGKSVDSFTIGFEDWDLSEHESARLAAQTFDTNHHEQFVNSSIYNKLKEVSYYYDEPLGGTSFLPTYELARMASSNTKVVLGGDGGDEVFAGYKWHQSYQEPWYKHPRGAVRNLLKGENTLVDHYRRAMNWTGMDNEEVANLLGPGLQKNSADIDLFSISHPLENQPVKSLQILDYQYFLPEVVLHKIDRASMAHSLEVRVPFLDHELVEYMLQLDETVYHNKKTQKKILFDIMKNRFPKPLLNKAKKGFGMSLNHFFDRKQFPTHWRSSNMIIDGLINTDQVQKYLDQNALKKLWSILIFMFWYDQWKK